jgi:hypothetical protein
VGSLARRGQRDSETQKSCSRQPGGETGHEESLEERP